MCSEAHFANFIADQTASMACCRKHCGCASECGENVVDQSNLAYGCGYSMN